jgi:GT2 family glycosyltransferase
VLVVSYNTAPLTRACLASVRAASAGLAVEVVVVDNASADGSAELVAREFPEARLIANRENVGFARANNQAFAAARGRYLMLLNPDTEAAPGTIRELLEFAEAHPRAGVVGPRVFLPSGEQQSTLFRLPRLFDLAVNLFVPNRIARRLPLLGRARYAGADLDRVQDVEVVAGCCMLVPRAVVDEIGGMDERFFMYGEEAEWCFRIRRAGWQILYFPGTRIVHHGGQSARQTPDAMVLAMTRSQLRLFRMVRGWPAAYAANLLMLARDLTRLPLWAVMSWLGGKGDPDLTRQLRPAALRVPLLLRRVVGQGWAESDA